MGRVVGRGDTHRLRSLAGPLRAEDEDAHRRLPAT
jgi:hypothetical protein